MTVEGFRQVTIEGNAEQRGYGYGQQLGSEILRTVQVYREFWQRDDSEILARADGYRRLLRQSDNIRLKEYSVEMDSMAKAIRGSVDKRFDPLWLYALNVRTELLSTNADECTWIYFIRPRCSARIGTGLRLSKSWRFC